MNGLKIARKSLAFSSVTLLAGGIIALFVFGQTAKWVGHTDLEVRFVIIDSETEHPISNATIHIRAEPGGLCDDSTPPGSEITTDENGQAKLLATNCMCFGSKGLFEETFASHLPQWSLIATSAGYSATKPEALDVPENARRVQRGDPFAAVTVRIRLQRTSE